VQRGHHVPCSAVYLVGAPCLWVTDDVYLVYTCDSKNTKLRKQGPWYGRGDSFGGGQRAGERLIEGGLVGTRDQGRTGGGRSQGCDDRW